MQEAQKRHHELYYYLAHELTFQQGTLSAPLRRIHCQEADSWYREEATQQIDLATMDTVLIRQDPPFDIAYITATHLLESLPDSVQVWNNPSAIRNLPEKWYAQEFSQFVPPTLITRDEACIRRFLDEQSDIVMKPLYGYGGRGVFRFTREATNLEAMLEHVFAEDNLPWMFQRFLPEVSHGDRRVILIHGEVHGVLGRIPEEGEIRANFRVGGTGTTEELSAKQQEICDVVGEQLRQKGILFAGLDLIGDWLTEINVTSPTGLRGVIDLYGTNPAVPFWDAIEYQ